MNLAYPIQAIFMYLSILFAPHDVEQITIEIPDQGPRVELVRNGHKWEFEGNVFAIEKDSLVTFGPEGRKALKMIDFIALPDNHDWSKVPKFTLGAGTTLEINPIGFSKGFTIRRNAAGGEGNGVYQIQYQKPGDVSVLGEVVNPGVYALAARGKIRDVIAAAGGPTVAANMKRVSIIRGPAGSVPEVISVDLTKTEVSSPHIQAGDTIHVLASGKSETDSSVDKKIGGLAEAWLGGLDAGDYAHSWKEAAEFFQKSITAEAWGEALTNLRKPLGTVKSRKIRDMKEANALPGAPDGKYWIIQFDSSFAAKAEAVETVTFMLDKDGEWKAAGYFIR